MLFQIPRRRLVVKRIVVVLVAFIGIVTSASAATWQDFDLDPVGGPPCVGGGSPCSSMQWGVPPHQLF